jgi:hypothetical protein
MTREIEIRLLALGSAACLCVPYMLIYDLAVIAPAAAARMFKPKPLQWGLGSIAFASPWTTPLLAGGAMLLAWATALPTRESRHESATKSMV